MGECPRVPPAPQDGGCRSSIGTSHSDLTNKSSLPWSAQTSMLSSAMDKVKQRPRISQQQSSQPQISQDVFIVCYDSEVAFYSWLSLAEYELMHGQKGQIPLQNWLSRLHFGAEMIEDMELVSPSPSSANSLPI